MRSMDEEEESVDVLSATYPAWLSRTFATEEFHFLDHPDASLRKKAVQAFAKLEPESLAQHANAVVEMLADSDDAVRTEAWSTLR